uniref:Protein-tyrosine-phosphatase n=1 Tax=Caenorhabditis japonica TaxID=281687 RepID=A0A8R1DPI5_CAEJA
MIFLPQVDFNKSNNSFRMSNNNKSLLSITQVRPHLFLSGYGCLTSSLLKQYNITRAVDCTNLKTKPIAGLEKIEVPVDDSALSKISGYFDTVIKYVEEGKQQGQNTVIYCAAGVSRSATLTIVYLMVTERLSLEDAYHQVNRVRPIISPNVGFWRQMIEFEKQLNGSTSVELISGRTAKPVPSVYLRREVC